VEGDVLNLPHDDILVGASSRAKDNEEAVVPGGVVAHILPEEGLDVRELSRVLEEVEATDEPLPFTTNTSIAH